MFTDEQRKEARLATTKRWRERHRLLIRARRNAETAKRRAARVAALGEAPTPTSKPCSRCKQDKSFDSFGSCVGRKHGLASYCRQCIADRYHENKPEPKPRRVYVRDIAKQREAEKRSRERIPIETKRRYLKEWKQKNPERYRLMHLKGENTRRAKKNAVFVEPIDHMAVYQRDGGKCGICSGTVDLHENWHVDHVVPIARGGIHAYSNVQLAHALCNLKKHAKSA